MIWILEIKLFQYDNENQWKVSVEIDSMSTLEDLYYLIQDAVDFDNDHLYEFYISKQKEAGIAYVLMMKIKKYITQH